MVEVKVNGECYDEENANGDDGDDDAEEKNEENGDFVWYNLKPYNQQYVNRLHTLKMTSIASSCLLER